MFRKSYSLSKQLVLAASLAIGATGAALADDSSMSRFGGDSYRSFNNPIPGDTATNSAWRQSHPNGLTERELQALSASIMSGAALQLHPPVFASLPTDPTWRQSHKNGLTEHELQALSASPLAMSQAPDALSATALQTSIAQKPSKDSFAARLATFFNPRGSAQAGANW